MGTFLRKLCFQRPSRIVLICLLALFRCLLQNYREDLIRDCPNKKDEDEILKSFNKEITNKELRMYDFLKLQHQNKSTEESTE